MINKKNNFWFIGDTHGNHKFIMYEIKQKDIKNVDMFHVGDFGVGFTSDKNEKEQLNYFNKFLKERGINLHVFRGNHDNPYYFKGNHIFSNLKLHKDYTVLEIGGNKILGVGGGISIDREPRKLNRKKVTWWEDEVFILNENKISEISGIDILITHTTPSNLPPINADGNFPWVVKQFVPDDPNLLHDLINERKKLSELLLLLKDKNTIKYHFYGHFHSNYKTLIDGCEHICLSINQFYELK